MINLIRIKTIITKLSEFKSPVILKTQKGKNPELREICDYCLQVKFGWQTNAKNIFPITDDVHISWDTL